MYAGLKEYSMMNCDKESVKKIADKKEMATGMVGQHILQLKISCSHFLKISTLNNPLYRIQHTKCSTTY